MAAQKTPGKATSGTGARSSKGGTARTTRRIAAGGAAPRPRRKKAPAADDGPDPATILAGVAAEHGAAAAAPAARERPRGPEPLSERLVAVARLLGDKKAIDPVLLELGEVTDFTGFFLIASGNSRTQVQAMADGVVRLFKKPNQQGLHIEGSADATWLLIDLGDFVVHLFQPEARRHYDLEGLWADAPRRPLPQ